MVGLRRFSVAESLNPTVHFCFKKAFHLLKLTSFSPLDDFPAVRNMGIHIVGSMKCKEMSRFFKTEMFGGAKTFGDTKTS